MANRSIQAKMLKIKRRGRYVRLSGAVTKTLSRPVQVLETEGEDKVTVKTVEVYVGLKSFGKQVVNTGGGFGVNRERMQQYYDHVPKETTLEDVFCLTKDKRYAQVWMETPATNRINLVQTIEGRLDLWVHGNHQWFFVDIDFKRKTIRRSREYGTKAKALARLNNRTIQWVETIPLAETTTTSKM